MRNTPWRNGGFLAALMVYLTLLRCRQTSIDIRSFLNPLFSIRYSVVAAPQTPHEREGKESF